LVLIAVNSIFQAFRHRALRSRDRYPTRKVKLDPSLFTCF
jgi:hypothetical protein